MVNLCFICKRRAGGREVAFPCYYCARAVADAVVRRDVEWVSARWGISEEFAQARALALEHQVPRSVEEAAEFALSAVSLAAAYVGLGMHGAALITGALALSWHVVAPEGQHVSATEVMFAETLLSAAGRKLLVEEFGWPSAEQTLA